MCDVWREACFSQKMFNNELNMDLTLWTIIKKTVHWVETHWLSDKKKFCIQLSVKKDMLTSFWDTKGPIIIYFLEKRCKT